jgi:site-specific recombinase XerC
VHGPRARDIPIPAELAKLLRQYLHVRGRTKQDDDHLFVGERKRRVNGVLLAMPLQAQVIQRAYRAVRPRLSPHTLRQSYAIQQLDQGENIALVHHRLGQRDFHATLRYASVAKHRAAVVRSPADDHQPGL